jgi:hypothetical protein
VQVKDKKKYISSSQAPTVGKYIALQYKEAQNAPAPNVYRMSRFGSGRVSSRRKKRSHMILGIHAKMRVRIRVKKNIKYYHLSIMRYSLYFQGGCGNKFPR